MDSVVFPLLAEPDTYSPNTFIYTFKEDLRDAKLPQFPSLEDWLAIFYKSIPSFKKIALEDPSISEFERPTRAAQFEDDYTTQLDELTVETSMEWLTQEEISARANCLELCRLRELALRNAGFQDAFLPIKQKENTSAITLLADVLQEIDAERDIHKRWDLCIRGICAANIFDLGAAHTTEMYHANGGVSFHSARDKLLPRPWAIDTLDLLLDSLASTTDKTYKKAIMFVDNSGADVILGMLPFARELLKQNKAEKVILAANELPSINDITAAELDALLVDISKADDVLCKAISTERLCVVSSGNDLPVIDLKNVSVELVELSRDADFVVLEGMGRSIETNLNAVFACDVLKIGMVKHPEVAAALGGRMLDCVVKFEKGSEKVAEMRESI